MCDVWNRGVIREFKRVVPILVSIKYCSTKAFRSKTFSVSIDLCDTLLERLAIPEQVSVMIQVVNSHLEATLPDQINVRRCDCVTLFRHNFKSGLESKRIVNGHN